MIFFFNELFKVHGLSFGFRCTFVFTANGSRKECPVLSCKHVQTSCPEAPSNWSYFFHSSFPSHSVFLLCRTIAFLPWPSDLLWSDKLKHWSKTSKHWSDRSKHTGIQRNVFAAGWRSFFLCPAYEGLVRAVGRVFLFFWQAVSVCVFSSSVVQQRDDWTTGSAAVLPL